MEKCKLMRPIFHENMFNREGRRIKVVHERTVSNGTETYPLWRAVRKSEPNFSWVDNDRYLLYAEINGYLIPLGMTNHELIYSCGSKPVEKKLYGGQKERSRHYDSLRESGGEQAVLAELDKEWAEIVKCGSDPACQAEYIQKTLAKHTETYLESKKNGGTTFPDFIGALILDDLDRCMELSPIYQKNCQQREQARAAQDAEKNRIFCEEQNSAARQKVAEAIQIIRNGGILENETLAFYQSRYRFTDCRLVSHLMRTYQINVPLRTQGWINNNLQSVTISNGKFTSCQFLCRKKSRGSLSFTQCMSDLIHAVMAENQEGGHGSPVSQTTFTKNIEF